MKRLGLILRFILVWAAAAPFLSAQQPPVTVPPDPVLPSTPSPSPALETVKPELLDEFAEAPPPRPRRPRRSARPAKETVVIAGNLIVAEGQTNGDTIVIAGKAEILGMIRGDLTVVAGAVRLGPRAEVTGDTVVVASALDADPAAILRGDRVVFGTAGLLTVLPWAGDWLRNGIMMGRPLLPGALWSWLLTAMALLLYLALAFLFPRAVQATVNSLAERPGASALAGALALVAFGPLLLLLAVMVIGLPLIPLVVCALGVALAFGKIAVYRYAGHQAAAQTGLTLLQKPLLALLVGAMLFCLLYTIPIVGLIAWGGVATVGLGAVLVTVFKRTSPSVTAPVDLVLPAAAGTSPTLLPRAGFWVRFLATLLDFVLVGLIVGPLLRQPKLFLPCWIAYHLALWWWRGTTLGGIVLGLGIVRLDNQPLTFFVVFVRLLGSFFSAALLGLGFFWAGWSANKQSWHDKIAGTVIVKFPAGTTLV